MLTEFVLPTLQNKHVAPLLVHIRSAAGTYNFIHLTISVQTKHIDVLNAICELEMLALLLESRTVRHRV